MRYRPAKPSKRAIAARLAFNAGDHAAVAVLAEAYKGGKTGPQAEGETNKAIAKWRALKPGLVLERNKRRLATPPGMTQPIMLGWLAEGSPDWLGYRSVVITQAMVGKRIAQFVGIEAKRAVGGVVSKEQQAFIDALLKAGGVAGIARNAQDAEDLLSAPRQC